MIKCVLRYQEEINDKCRDLRFDDDVIEGLKMFNKLMELNCAVVEMEVKSFGPGVHVNNDAARIG